MRTKIATVDVQFVKESVGYIDGITRTDFAVNSIHSLPSVLAKGFVDEGRAKYVVAPSEKSSDSPSGDETTVETDAGGGNPPDDSQGQPDAPVGGDESPEEEKPVDEAKEAEAEKLSPKKLRAEKKRLCTYAQKNFKVELDARKSLASLREAIKALEEGAH